MAMHIMIGTGPIATDLMLAPLHDVAIHVPVVTRSPQGADTIDSFDSPIFRCLNLTPQARGFLVEVYLVQIVDRFSRYAIVVRVLWQAILLSIGT